ncbi:hypothetical protein LZ32DRAFT_692417 [Colletotrichum eremochloae]|nr:hypothetical protein LZ32DRAFT_692417 [Colletotrichum eremochloae]
MVSPSLPSCSRSTQSFPFTSSSPSEPPTSQSSTFQSKGYTSRIPRQPVVPEMTQGDLDEINSVWRDCIDSAGMDNTLIVAVISQSHYKEFDRLRKREATPEKASRIVFCHPGILEHTLEYRVNRNLKSEYLRVHILVSSFIEAIKYHVGKAVKELMVKVCGTLRPLSPCKVRIDNNSTYCSRNVDNWHSRGEDYRQHKLIHDDTCYFSHRDHPKGNEGFLQSQSFEMNTTGDMLKQIQDLFADIAQGVPSQVSVTPTPDPEAPNDSTRPNDSTTPTDSDPWFSKFKAIIAGVAGVCVAGGYVVGCSAAGVYIQGPLGFKLAIGAFHGGFAAGSLATGGLYGTAAAVGVYLIPWRRIFAWLKKALHVIWDSIKNAVIWMWEKIKAMASSVVSWFI